MLVRWISLRRAFWAGERRSSLILICDSTDSGLIGLDCRPCFGLIGRESWVWLFSSTMGNALKCVFFGWARGSWEWLTYIASPATTTGWSNKTVNCNSFVTGVKITENGKTQPFLEMIHREVLIFWCLESVRRKQSRLLMLCQIWLVCLQPDWIPHGMSPQTHPWAPLST